MFPFWLLRLGVWGIGAVLLLYGGANLAVRALMALETPASMTRPGQLSILCYGTRSLFWAASLLSAYYAGSRQTGTPTGRGNDKVTL